MGLNELLMLFFADVVMRHYMVSKVISAAVGFLVKYFARKKILFSQN